MDTERLSDHQQQLVSDHLKLVTREVKHYTNPYGPSRHDRDPDDLYQEGCLGLIRAAKSYDPASNIRFSSYAMRRIRHAMSIALQERSTLIRRPRPRSTQKKSDPTQHIHSLEYDPPTRQSRSPKQSSTTPTVGERIRQRIDHAIHEAGNAVKRGNFRRNDRAQLIERIVEQRFKIPDPLYKEPLRALARHTDSSYSRVASCEKKMAGHIRMLLSSDPEYRALIEQARSSPEGMDQTVDSCEHIIAARLQKLLTSLGAQGTQHLITVLLAFNGTTTDQFIRRLFNNLDADQQSQLLDTIEQWTRRAKSVP